MVSGPRHLQIVAAHLSPVFRRLVALFCVLDGLQKPRTFLEGAFIDGFGGVVVGTNCDGVMEFFGGKCGL